jgi:hypothetical protein
MYYCGKCNSLIYQRKDTICKEEEHNQSCQDLTVENFFHWFCLPCLGMVVDENV